MKNEWDGIDYYTGNVLIYDKNNPYDPNYPNVDHKISIKYGYEHGISIEELSSYDNLCITSRFNNISKNSKTEDEFLKKEGVK